MLWRPKKYHKPFKRNLIVYLQITVDDGAKHNPGAIYSLGVCEHRAAWSWRNVLGKHLHVPASVLSISIKLGCCWKQEAESEEPRVSWLTVVMSGQRWVNEPTTRCLKQDPLFCFLGGCDQKSSFGSNAGNMRSLVQADA